jgi:tetratricopeptide (TPR) repeat protein
LLRDYADTPSVTNKLFDLALYKIIEASLAVGDEAQATNAAAKILAWFPTSYYGQYGGLLLGEDLTRKNDYALARREFSALTNQPTPLAARAAFAIARTYGFEGDWPEALQGYGQWVTNYPKDPLLAEVEFERALACDKAGQESNALQLMTNFVARFDSNHLAPWAQNWIADYYYNLGDYPKAEIHYEELYDKWPNAEGDLAYRARFMAGKAAFLRQDPGEAESYFTNLINLPATPPAIRNEAYSALADAIYKLDPTNTLSLSQAIAAESKLTNGAPTNAAAAPAFGRLGDFYYQGKDYVGARQMYGAALVCGDVIDKATRCQAEIGLGNAALMLQQTNEALLHFNTVLYHIDDPGPFWTGQAGQAAAGVLEDLGQWEAAKNVYQRVLNTAPTLRPLLERKIAAAQQNMDAARNKE